MGDPGASAASCRGPSHGLSRCQVGLPVSTVADTPALDCDLLVSASLSACATVFLSDAVLTLSTYELLFALCSLKAKVRTTSHTYIVCSFKQDLELLCHMLNHANPPASDFNLLVSASLSASATVFLSDAVLTLSTHKLLFALCSL